MATTPTATSTPTPTSDADQDTAAPTQTADPDTATATSTNARLNSIASNNANATETTHMPLTTVFTPPAVCTDRPWTYVANKSGISTYWRDAYGPGDGVNSVCYPPDFQYLHRTTISGDYSPGVCPYGYTAASTRINTTETERRVHTSWCCPSGMDYTPSIGCYSTVTTPTLVNVNAKTRVSMTEPFVAADWAVQVAWRSNQLDIFTPESAPLHTPSPTPTQTNLDDAGLSDQQQTAITVGIPVSVVTTAVIAVACYALWRRKRKQNREAMSSEEDDYEKDGGSSSDDRSQRYGSANGQAERTSNDTPITNATEMSEGSASGNERDPGTLSKGPRIESWPDSFDETAPVTEPR